MDHVHPTRLRIYTVQEGRSKSLLSDAGPSESVLSLMIVETTESRDYYLIATLCCVSIFFLQALKFESEPSHADGHALYRNFRNATSLVC